MRVLVITTSRADWNSLGMVAWALDEAGALVHVAVHASHGGIAEVRGEWSAATIYGDRQEHPSLLSGDAASLEALRKPLEGLRPNMVLVCGDRHETLLAAFAATLMGIPVAHLAGGDVSGGSLDEHWRHAITKMATVHFPTHELAARRIIQMGEDPAHVHMVGSASADRVLSMSLCSRKETLFNLFGWPRGKDGPFILANWQPETPVDEGLPELLDALRVIPMSGVFVGVNPDPGALRASNLIAGFCRHANGRRGVNWVNHQNLSPTLYLSALKHAALLIGNSSSGFYEAPYFGTPVINVGHRQRGRSPVPACMIQAPADSSTLVRLLRYTDADPEFHEVPEHLFGDGHAAQQIATILLSYAGKPAERKLFHDH